MASQIAGFSSRQKSITISLGGVPLLLLLPVLLASLHGADSSPLNAAAQPLRQVGSHHAAAGSANSNATAIDQIAALLKARPRQTLASNQNNPPVNSNNNNNKPREPKRAKQLVAQASARDERQSVSSNAATPVKVPEAAGAKKSASSAPARPQPGKRQADFASGGGGDPQTTSSRRNEDPWFLDQAPLPLQPYRFSYNIKDKNGLTEQYRQEAGDGKFTTGSYGYVLPDGIYRHVDYVADDRGFHVFLRTTEPGTANQNPADVVINANPVVTPPGSSYASVRADAPGGGGGGAGLLPYTPGVDLPASAYWNYSALLPASAYSPSQTPLIDLLRNSAAAAAAAAGNNSSLYDGTLARRPPGSIVNTPARNFTSFAYGNQPPLPTASSGLWPWSSQRPTDFGGGSGSGGSDGYQFQSLTPKPAQPSQLTPPITSGFGASNLTSQQPHSSGIWGDRAGNLNPNEQRASPGAKQSTSGNLDPPGPSYLGNPLVPLGGYFGPSRLAPLYTPARVGPDVLLYDRPFTVQTSAPGGAAGAPKLTYDNNHVLYANSPILSLERAKNLAHLEQINAVTRLASGQLSPLPFFGPIGSGGGGGDGLSAPATGSNLSLADQIRLGLLNGISTTTASHHSSTQHQHHEHSHEHQHSSRQLVGDANKVLLSKEHESGSGSSSASGHALDYDSRQPSRDQQQQQENPQQTQTELPPLPPPPPPQFNAHNHNAHMQAHFKPIGVKGASDRQQQQQAARLLAPYVDEQAYDWPGQTLGQVKGGNSKQQQQQIPLEDDDQRHRPAFNSISPKPPTELRAPLGPAPPATASQDQEPPSGITTQAVGGTKSTPPSRRESSDRGDEIELRQQTGAPPLPPPPSGSITRTVRMPNSDYRTSVLMNDLRSMQNLIGLPQPPRLQRSSDHQSSLIEHPAGGHAHSHPTAGPSLAEQMVAARMRRVEDLLRHAHTGTGAPPSSPPQQASVQQAVAVRATRRELDELGARQRAADQQQQQRQAQARTNRTSSAGQQQQQEQEQEQEHRGEIEGSSLAGDDDQPRRRMGTGPVLKIPAANTPGGESHAAQEPAAGGGAVNETASFEAQRLSAKAARLRADKVSELEKFQQRLRTQQLHLIEQRSSSDKPAPISSQQKQQQQQQQQQQQHQQSIRPNSEANSHVKYDEPNENEISTHQLSGALAADNRKRDQYPRPRRQNEVEAPAAKSEKVKDREPQTTTTSTTPAPQSVSDFARKLQSWPSLQLDRQHQQGHPNELPADLSSSLAGKPQKPTDQQHGIGQNKTQHGEQQQQQQKPAGPNTINLDFINSVTALSVDHLNPFAISSVNPAVQRSSSAANSERLSPHRLSLPALGNGGGTFSPEQQVGTHAGQSSGGATRATANGDSVAGFVSATSPARYHSSPDLLAALDYHEKRETSDQLRGLLGQTHSNHQSGAASSLLGAPYMMQSPLSNHRAADAPMSSRLLIGTGSQLFEAANSQHKSFMPMPKQLKTAKSDETKTENKNRPVASSSASSSTVRIVEPPSSSVLRDGFEIRDRAIQVDNHRFFEVVSSLRNPSETSAGVFQAFRG